MKKSIKSYGLTIVALLLIFLVFAIVIASIRQLNLIPTESYQITTIILGLFGFFLGGLFLGYNIEKHGLLHATIFSIIYLSLIFLILFLGYNRGLELEQIVKSLAKATLLIIGSIIGRNLKGY